MTEECLGQVVPIHRANLHSGRVANLAHLSLEQAATALVEAFQRTGYAEATVSDLDRTRSLVRRDCRRRRLKVQTIAAGSRIVVMDESRHDRWLQIPEGQAYQERAEEMVMDALSGLAPKGPRPRGPQGS